MDARDVNRDDVTMLQEKYNIDSDLLADIMDQDEQSRIEKEDEYIDLILRLPSLSENDDTLDQQALPVGIVLFPNLLITICQGTVSFLRISQKTLSSLSCLQHGRICHFLDGKGNHGVHQGVEVSEPPKRSG